MPQGTHAATTSGLLDDHRSTVLVVEDDPEIQALLEHALSSHYRVMPTASVRTAFDLATRLQPDLVVCDLGLADGCGEQLVRLLRDHPQTTDISVIVVSGTAEVDLNVRLLRLGADDVLLKPFMLEELRARVDKQIASRLERLVLTLQVDEAQRRAEQLQHALTSRVVIEQAKAFVAAERRCDLDTAFDSLRAYARSQRLRIHDVAHAVVHDGLRW